MKRTFTGLVMASVILLAACQKEIDWGTGGGVVADQLLVKILSKTGTDSSVTTYTYNSAKQLVRENTVGVAGTNSIDNDLKITRNSAGIIQKTVQVASALIANGIDSLVIRYNYSTALTRYSSAVFNVTVMGTAVTDSVSYVYDASGKITSDEHYLKASLIPIPILGLRNMYTYSADGLNLTGSQQYGSSTPTPGGPLTLQASQTYSYDSKKNPLIIKQEAILLVRPGLFSAQNPVSSLVTNTTDPTQDFSMDFVYRYNTAGKPDSSYGTRSPGGTVTASKYYYQ